jgi:hypothetical protein
MPLVTPEPGEDLALLARTLLALADDPREVTYVVGDHLFTVSDAVADRFLASLSLADEEPKPKAAAKKAVPAKKAAPKKEG